MINLFCFFNSKFFLREESKRNRRFLLDHKGTVGSLNFVSSASRNLNT